MTIEAQLPDGRILEFPDGTSPSVIQAAAKRILANPLAGQSTEALESAKSAPMSFGDTFKSLSSGIVGGGKSLVDFFGAGTDVSKGLGEAQSFLQESLSPERKAEIARREELQNRAAQSGSMLQEAKAFLGGVAEAPIQSLAQAAGSSAPAILTGILALPVEAPAALAIGVGTIAKLAVGAMQGVGEMKGGVFDAVKAEYMKQGKTEKEAEVLAIKAQEYSRDKALEIGGSALLGALDAVTGAESSAAKALRKASPTGMLTKEAIEKGIAALPEKAIKAPSYLGQFALGVAEESPLEGAQGAFGQYAENVALQKAGADVTPMQGVLGAGLRDAAVGALFGGAASPMSMKSARQEYATDQFLRQAKEDIELDKRAAETAREKREQVQRTQSQLGVPVTGENVSNVLMLPAPSKAYAEPKDPLQDPVGRITEDELGKAIGDNTVVNYLNKYRKDNNLPKLKSYSIEDIKDAMTAQNPEGEEGALNAILAYKTNYQNEAYTPEDINNAAVAKNVATETKGWNDFLTRATGKSDLNTMTQPELHSVAKALEALPRTGKEEQLVLPEGSNATRFTQEQYNGGVTAALLNTEAGKPVSYDEALKRVQTQKGVDSDQAADRLLKAAAANDDLVIEKGTGFQATNKAGEVLGTYATEAEAKRNHRRSTITPVETDLVRAREEEKTDKVAQLPEGYGIEQTAEVGEERPAAYVLREEGSQKNASQTFSEEVDAQRHQELLTRKREANAVAEEASANRIRQDLERQQAKIAQMEADGLTGTAEHTKAVNAFKAANVAKSEQITQHLDKAEALRAPLKIVPLGKKSTKVGKHTVIKNGKKIGTFDTKTKAEQHVLSQATEEELQTIADRGGVFGKRAEVELDTRKRPGVRRATTEGLEKAGVHTPEVEAKLTELKAKLLPMLKKFGLEQVGLNVVRAIENDADGAWGKADKLIRIALQATEPIKTMRHEALHALKELGFFTPQQWEALKRQAEKTWINTYLKGQMVKVNGKTMTRYDAYANGVKNDDGSWALKPLSPEDILEEAIADAFGSWESGAKPPPGMMAALFKRMQQFFSALKQALTGAGFESAEDIFGKIERGELKAGKEEAGSKVKLSLRQGVPVSTVPIMEADDTEARAELGLNTKAVRNRFNSVRDIAIALNKATKDAFGQMDQNNLTSEDMDRIAKAIADEVGYQLSTTSETGTGTGWYSTNYPNAVKRLAKRFPELETNPTARAVFSAVVAVSSNGERVATNIKNAIKMYERIRQGKKMIAVGSRRATALENNLIMIQDLLDEHGDNFEQELLKTTTVKDMNAALRAKGEKADTSYLADTTVPAAAIYFGPKLGAFFANLSGAEGYLTMDLWWSRTINRMRGLLIPKATDASINTFREMMDIPSASREEVVAATIPLAAKYKEYGFNTELEHLMKSKEPKEKVNKPKWFAKAEKVVGDAYEQLLYEHKLEKIANTIHKNEFEMLEEAPFTGTDRKFMYDAARKAQGILRSRGVNLTLADVQAALWYYEKRLYQKLSGRKADDIGYEEAINSQAAQSIGRARPSVVFGGKPDSGTVAGREITGSEELRGILADSTSDERKYSLRSGVIVEVAPNPDQEVANKWREMTPDERLNTTKAVASKAVNRVLDELGFKGYTSYFSSGKYEGEVNPNIIIEAPDGTSAEDLRELASVLGYVLDQKAMVAFDESNKSSGDQNTFIKVVPPSDMSEADLERLRRHIADSVPQADGDTLRDDALLFGNFSSYNDNVETLSDKQYHQAILDAIESFDYDGTIRVSEPETFHSEMIWPESRSDYLKGTRYGKSGEVQGREGPDVRGSGISRLQTISDEAIALRDRWIDSRGSARRGSRGERSKVDIGQPTAEYGQKRENAESVIGVHFSQQPRAVLSSYFHGNGIRGLEKERLSDPANKDIRDRVYFYTDTGKGVFPEESVGGVQHVIRLNNLYDIQKDPLKIVKTNTGVDAADRASKLERKILKVGYDGYVTRDPIQNQGFAVLVGDHGIETNVGKYSLRTFFPTAEEAENAAYKKAPPGTAEFKRFFGGSKVMEEGRAQPMYHASMEDFNIFRENRPIFVSPDAGFAEDFIRRRIRESGSLSYLSEGQVKKKTAKIYPLWVRAETPFDYDNKEHVQQIVNYLQTNNQVTGERVQMAGLGLMKPEEIAKGLSQGKWTVIEDGKTQEALKALGFDSFYTSEGGAKNLAVFKANQLKSITGNLGGFDESGDIRYSLKNSAIHSGNLRYGRDTTLGRIDGSRDTGHFGTGVYFVSNIDKLGLDSRFSGRSDRPIHQVDLSPYKLAKPISNYYAQRLHDGLRIVNRMVGAEYESREEMTADLDKAAEMIKNGLDLKESDPEIKKIILSAVKTAKRNKTDEVIYTDKYLDSASTMVIKGLGFDGIDVRRLDEFDNTKYGTVVYRESLPAADAAPQKYSLRTSDEPMTKDNVVAAMKFAQTKQPYTNCQLCIQMATGVSNLRNLPKVQQAKIGDIYTFNEKQDMASHYAVDVGNGDVVEIEGWGEDVRVIPLSEVEDEYGPPSAIRRPPASAYTAQKYSLKPVSADIDAAIDRTTTAREEQGFIGRILEAIFPKSAGHFRQQALNRYNQLGVYDKMLAEKMGGAALLADSSAESAALMSDLSASVTASAFGVGNRTGGVPVYKNGFTTIDTSVKGPIAILAPLAKYNNPRIYQRYQFWAGVKRGKRFMADGKEKNFEQADIARAAQLEKDHPEFVQIQKEMNEFNNGLVKYMVQTGVLKPELAKVYMEHADYIPFYRQMDGEHTVGPNIFQSISGVKPPKALKGSEAPLADYLETVVRNTQSAINSGMKNVAAQRAVGVAEKIGMAQRLNKVDSAPDTVQVMEKGERVSYRVADPLFIDACRSLNLPDLPFMGLLAAPANTLRNLVTKDPGFMLANLMRDSLSAWVTSGANITPLAGTVANFTKNLVGKTPGMEALLNAGILGGYEFSSGVLKSGQALESDMNKKYGKATGAKVLLKPFTSLWDALEKGTEASDAATRIAIYERVLAETGNEAEAIFRSLEVMNFNRKGSSAIIRIATAAIPFLNARMQGLDIFYRTAFGRDTDANAAAKQRAFFVRGATLMALSIAMFAMVSDDDEYKKQEEETKDNYWIIPGVGKFPVPFEVGFLFKTVPERIFAYAFKDDTGEDLKESMKRGITNTLAFNPVPQTFKPIAEAMVNYNSFTGRPIVGAGMEGRAPEFQVGPSTSEVAEKLGGALGLSPLKIDHVLQGYTGTVGMYLVQLVDSVLNANDQSPHAAKRFEQLPIIKRFALDPEARGNITQFYALKNATDEAVTSINFLEKAGDPEKFADYFEKNAGLLANKGYVQAIEKEMKRFREARAVIQSAEMTAEEKRDILTDIGRAENALTQNIKEVKKVIKEQ
jgi:hypothetical protein